MTGRSARGAELLLAMSLGVAASTGSAASPDPERGRLLYENHCRVCHTEKVHARTPRLALNRQELREIVAKWAELENLRWGPEEIEDVVRFLNLTRYHC
jgi:mono/diheme cytochrome c family protein